MKHNLEIRQKVQDLRRGGKTYSEILNLCGNSLAKGTVSNWCKNIQLPEESRQMIEELKSRNLEKARKLAKISKDKFREAQIKDILEKNKSLINWLKQKEIAKITLAILYFAEGAKTLRGTVMFGNSDPRAIRLFLKLMRFCYHLDEKKFRGTVQCRADQNEEQLRKFWSNISGISLIQFYKSRVDFRSVGKPTKKVDYKGVFRIDYFSAQIDLELQQIINILCTGPIV